MPQSGFEPLHADWHSLGGTELNHETIWKVAWLWLLCFDKDIFANNSIIIKIWKIYDLLFPLVFEYRLSWEQLFIYLDSFFYLRCNFSSFFIDMYGDIILLPTCRQKENVTIQDYVKKLNFRDIYKIITNP